MATQNETLIQRRKAALAAKAREVPAVEPAEVPETPAKIQPLTRPMTSSNGTGVARSVPLTVMPDPTRELTQDDLIMPKLKISQAMSKVNADDVVRQGNYYHTTLNTNLGKNVLVIPVDMRKSRSYFVTGKGVLCRSFDLLQGEGDPGIACEGTEQERRELPKQHRGCPLRLWGDRDESGKSAPPPCSEAYNYPVLILDPEDPENGPTKRALLTMRGSAAKTAKQINSIVTDGDYQWHEVVLELGLEQRTNAKGTFFVPTVEFHSVASGTSAEKARKFAATFDSAAIRATAESSQDDEE